MGTRMNAGKGAPHRQSEGRRKERQRKEERRRERREAESQVNALVLNARFGRENG